MTGPILTKERILRIRAAAAKANSRFGEFRRLQQAVRATQDAYHQRMQHLRDRILAFRQRRRGRPRHLPRAVYPFGLGDVG